LSQLTPEQAAAISEINTDEVIEGRGEDGRIIKKVKLKLHDKKGALDSVARHLGMFRDDLPGGNVSVVNNILNIEEGAAVDMLRRLGQAAMLDEDRRGLITGGRGLLPGVSDAVEVEVDGDTDTVKTESFLPDTAESEDK